MLTRGLTPKQLTMSRTTLKKAIKDFDADELRQLIMDVYTRSKEAREILDFYAVPDIAAKREQIEKPIIKELTRRYKGSPKPRFTRIKAQIKRFANLDVGDQAVASLMGFVVLESVKNCGDGSYLSDTTLSAIVKFFGETIDFMLPHLLLEEWQPQFEKAINNMPSRRFFKNPLQTAMLEVIREKTREAEV